MISFIQLLVIKLVEIQAFFLYRCKSQDKKVLKGANEANRKVLKGANGNENMLEYLYIKHIL